MIDLHHIPNVKDGKRLIENFNIHQAVVIALPTNEHKKIKHFDFSKIHNSRILLAKEIMCVRRHIDVPSYILLKIIEANKKKYPECFKK